MFSIERNLFWYLQEINMVATDLSVTYPRSLVIDFTIAFSHDPMDLLIPYPQLDSTISGIVKPFQYKVCIVYAI